MISLEKAASLTALQKGGTHIGTAEEAGGGLSPVVVIGVGEGLRMLQKGRMHRALGVGVDTEVCSGLGGGVGTGLNTLQNGGIQGGVGTGVGA